MGKAPKKHRSPVNSTRANDENGQSVQRRTPTRLHLLHPLVVTRILVFLSEEDREAYPKFDSRFTMADKTAGESRQERRQRERKERHNHKAGDKKDGPKGEKPEAALVKKQQEVTISDPFTLLARLNTRRLYKRIRYLEKTNRLVEERYPKNKATHEIAAEEWRRLLLQDDRFIPSPYELLMFSPCPRSVTILASYPRSGNSLMRNLFERTTLRVTGSDMRGGLTKHDLVGEAAVGANMVQFVKTHFPERRGSPAFKASRVVLLVRNPYDAIESFFNLMMTNTHTTSLSDDERKQYQSLWEEHVLKEIQVWRGFHEYWLAQEIPLLLVKYEDLIRFPDKVMARVTQFVLEINDMDFFNNRIARCIVEEQKIEKLGSYKPRSGGIGKSLSKYSTELLTKMNVGIISMMEDLGYDEMLVPEPDQWELEPVDDYGAELYSDAKKEIMINEGEIVRGPKTSIDWMAIRKIMNDKDPNAKKCTCYRCRQDAR